MSDTRIFVLYAPSDDEWATTHTRRLRSDGYKVYMEPPNADPDNPTIQERTAKALYHSTIMLAVVSRESAIGDSAGVFEEWWRPFMESGRQIIPCIVPNAPPGAEHWMPFDLYRQKPVDFREDDAYQLLRLRLPESSQPLALPAPEEAPAIEPEPEPPPTIPQPPAPPPPPPEPAPGILKTALSVVVGLSALLLIWLAAFQTTDDTGTSASIWIAGLFVGLGCLFVIGRMAASRRERQALLEHKQQQAAQYATESPVYLEVIRSSHEREIGERLGWPTTSATIGSSHRADLPLRDQGVDKLHCMVFMDEDTGGYYLENTSTGRTVLVDRPLALGAVMEIQNGDVIALGEATVLQFRINRAD